MAQTNTLRFATIRVKWKQALGLLTDDFLSVSPWLDCRFTWSLRLDTTMMHGGGGGCTEDKVLLHQLVM